MSERARARVSNGDERGGDDTQVVSQERFAAHWEQCEGFDYARVQERSPTNGAASAVSAAAGALKLKIGLTKQGQVKPATAPMPTKFVSGKNPSMAAGQLTSKKRKGEEMQYVDPHVGHVEIEVITCDGCGMSPIYQNRYSCNQCDDYDLCQACYLRGPAQHLGHDPTHDFCLLAIPVVSSGAKRSLLGSDLLAASHGGSAGAGRAGGMGDGKQKKILQMDLDRICGVTLETGHRCMRTIDCKAHTQLAKREVLGRSRPYDELLAERKALKATQQQALLNAQAGAAPMHLRPGKTKQERSEEEEAAAAALFPGSGIKKRRGDGWPGDCLLPCFAGVWDANGLPVPGRLPLLEHVALCSTLRVDASPDGAAGEVAVAGSGGWEGETTAAGVVGDAGGVGGAAAAEGGGGGGGGGGAVGAGGAGMFAARGGLGGGCPLAVGFVARRENSIFSLMCRKQSTDVMNPYPPELPFLGLYSKHAIAHLDEPRARTGGGKKAKGDETASTPTSAGPGKKGGAAGSESPFASGAKGKGAAAGGAQGAAGAEGMWPAGQKPPPKKKAKNSKALGAPAAAGVGPGGMAQGAPGGMGALGSMPGAAAAAKGKGKAKPAANGRAAGAGGQGGGGGGGAGGGQPGQVPGTAASAQRLGYGPKMPGNKQGGQAQSNAAARAVGAPQQPVPPRLGSGQVGMKQGAGAPPAQGKAGQGPGQAADACASAAPHAPPLPAPIRVRQAFRWAYNLRKKTIDKSRIRKS